MNIKQIQTGDILLSSSKSLIARLIQWFQKKQSGEAGKYNHAMLAYRDETDKKIYVLEADKKGIIKTDFEKEYINNSKYIEIIGLTPNFRINKEKMIEISLPYINKSKYDYFTLFIAQPIKILTFGKIWLGEKKQNSKKFICSEWVAFVYSESYNFVFSDKLSIAPVDFLNYKKYFKKYLINP